MSVLDAVLDLQPIPFADPYTVCNECGGWITGYRAIGATRKLVTVPCEHECGYESVCPSWSPVDGCCCQEHLGRVPHAQPPPR